LGVVVLAGMLVAAAKELVKLGDLPDILRDMEDDDDA
jgi:hypothetical protein